MKNRIKLPKLYGASERTRKLSTEYAVLVESLCNSIDKGNIEKLGVLRNTIKFAEMGVKEGIKEDKKGGNVYRDIFFRRHGLKPPKYDSCFVKEVRKELEELEKRCRLIEVLPRTKKTLEKLSENMSVPEEELERHIRRAEKEKVVEKTADGSYHLTMKGLEVAYATFSRKNNNDEKMPPK